MPGPLLIAAAAGLLCGVLYAAMSAGSFGGVLFAYLSPLPLFAVGLSLGALAAAVAGAVATPVIGASVVFGGGDAPTAVGLFVGTTVFPTWLIVRQALLNRPGPNGPEYYPPGLLLAWLTVLAAAGVAGTGLLLSGHPEGPHGAIRDWLEAALGGMLPPDGTEVDAASVADWIALVFLGFVATSWMVMMTINASLAQGALSGFGRNIRPSPTMADIDLPRWCYVALAASAAIGIALDGALGYIARNLAITFAVPVFFQGLGVLHALARRLSAPTVALFVLYLVLVILRWPVLAVVAIGLAEPLLRLKRRFGPPKDRKEEE